MSLLNSVYTYISNGKGLFGPFLGMLFASLCSVACESVFDHPDACLSGINLRFVYDYHMERGANAFPANVDCIDVYVFNNEGSFVAQFSETSSILQDENYRMLLPLQPGNYSIVVYGGLACSQRRFSFFPDWNNPTSALLTQQDISVTLPQAFDGFSNLQLHDLDKRTGGLFYGIIPSLTISNDDMNTHSVREETVSLIKNTNNIQVVLQELNEPYSLNHEDFDFRIIDDNFVLDGKNNIHEIATQDFNPHYKPYAAENRTMGYVDYVPQDGAIAQEDTSRPVQVACAEFSTSRLTTDHMSSARLVISNRETGEKLVDLPLITYLTAIRGFGDGWIKSDQEFLDRQSRWNLMLFLQNGKWSSVRISVNSWVVRLNDVEL